MTTDVIIPVWYGHTPQRFLDCIDNVIKNTPDINLILASSVQSQPVNVNSALERVKSEFVAILDWDTIVPPRWLRILTKNLQHNPDIGIIGAKMTGEYMGTNRNAELGVQEWPTLAGGCVVFRNIGLRWDEKFPSGYWADTDFCRQFKEKGYKVAINGDVEVEHYPNTFGSNPKKVEEWSELGRKIYIEKWGNDAF